MNLSVVISTFNRHKLLARTLLSILEQDHPADDYEVIVVVDGSGDGTAQMLRSVRSQCALHVIEQENRGLACARNTGWMAARGEIILFWDDDLVAERSVVRRHVAAHQTAGGAVYFGANTVSAETADPIIRQWAGALDATWHAQAASPKPHWPEAAAVDANTSLARALLVECGGYDERFRHRENLELGLRLWASKGPFTYLPQARGAHIWIKDDRGIVREGRAYGTEEAALCRTRPEYRPYSAPAALFSGGLLKRAVKAGLTRSLVDPEPFLRAAFRIVKVLPMFSPLRPAAARLLQFRQTIAQWRSALKTAGGWNALKQEFGMRLPVLLYHNVSPTPHPQHPELTVSPRSFRKQLLWMAWRGYTAISAADWHAYLRLAKPLPRKPVLITFDDGYANLSKHAFPILEKYGFRAVTFVPSALAGRRLMWDDEPVLSVEEIQKWYRRGFEFCSHGSTHARLTEVASSALTDEIEGSAAELTSILGEKPIALAYPYGAQDSRVREIASANFALSFGTDEGVNDLRTELPNLRRSMVQPKDGVFSLQLRLWLGRQPLQNLRMRAGLRTRFRAAWQQYRETMWPRKVAEP